jgi:hypothetical protein
VHIDICSNGEGTQKCQEKRRCRDRAVNKGEFHDTSACCCWFVAGERLLIRNLATDAIEQKMWRTCVKGTVPTLQRWEKESEREKELKHNLGTQTNTCICTTTRTLEFDAFADFELCLWARKKSFTAALLLVFPVCQHL